VAIGLLAGCSSSARFSHKEKESDNQAIAGVPKKKTAAMPEKTVTADAEKRETTGTNIARASLLAIPEIPKKPRGFSQTGIASYYARKFHGRRTASGERYDMYALTAAHPRLPFGTMVKVTNLSNKRTVIVRINDRGPHTKKRVIDLSLAAAKRIDMVRSGTARVLVEVAK
jgi:rare lipoprotein A